MQSAVQILVRVPIGKLILPVIRSSGAAKCFKQGSLNVKWTCHLTGTGRTSLAATWRTSSDLIHSHMEGSTHRDEDPKDNAEIARQTSCRKTLRRAAEKTP